MDSLDNVELDSTKRRSRLMRSWYLYEQYKSLEKNQLEAAQQLHHRTSQHVQLHRELSKHRQRRHMGSECHSEPSVDIIRRNSSRSCVTCSINDMFESLCQDPDDEFFNADTDATSIPESCLWGQDEKELHAASEQFKTVIEDRERNQCNGGEDLNSMPRLTLNDTLRHTLNRSNNNLHHDRSLLPVANDILADGKGLLHAVSSDNLTDRTVLLSASSENFIVNDGALLLAASSSNLADDMKEELEYVKRSIVENIHLQLEMKDNVQSLEGYTKPQEYERKAIKLDGETPLYAGDKNMSDEEGSLCSLLHHSFSERNEHAYNMFALWAKLVSFSYQVVQLNHGNCYYDYSSLLMTAVLACDVIRHGISRMCNVLQPYVSPIKFVSNCSCGTPNPYNTIKKAKNKKSLQSQTTNRTNKGIKYQIQHMRSRGVHNNTYLKSPSKTSSGVKSCRTDNIYSFDNSRTKIPIRNEVSHSFSTYRSITLPSEKQSSTRHDELNSKCSEFNSCCTRISNPMLKLATYIDSIIQDIDNSNF